LVAVIIVTVGISLMLHGVTAKHFALGFSAHY